MKILVFVTFILALPLAVSAIPHKATNGKFNKYITDGAIIGGVNSGKYSLIAIRKGYNKKIKVERLVFSFGDLKGLALKKNPGYYHINVDKKLNKVELSFTNVIKSKVNTKIIRKIFKDSEFVKQTQVMYEPESYSTIVVLYLKDGLAVEAYSKPKSKKPGRLFLDIKKSTRL